MNILETGVVVWIMAVTVTLFLNRKERLGSLCGNTIAVTLLMLVALICVGGLISTVSAVTEVVDRQFAVRSAFSTQEYHGSFVLGTGSIDAVDCYVFYMDTASGWSRRKEVTDGVYIREVPGVRPTAVFQVTQVVDNWFTRYTMQAGKVEKFQLAQLIVPTGTIYQKFDLR